MVPNLVPDEPILRLPTEAVVLPVRVKAAIEPVPKLKLLEKRLVEEAVVEKKLVVVAEVPVAVVKVKDWRVLEALARKLVKVPEPEVKVPIVAVLVRKSVED